MIDLTLIYIDIISQLQLKELWPSQIPLSHYPQTLIG